MRLWEKTVTVIILVFLGIWPLKLFQYKNFLKTSMLSIDLTFKRGENSYTFSTECTSILYLYAFLNIKKSGI